MIYNNIFLIDLSNLGHTCFFSSIQGIFKPEDCPPNWNKYLEVFRDRIQSIATNIGAPNVELVFALDKKPKWKYELYPEYKSNRKDRKMQFNPIDSVVKMVKTWPCKTIFCDDHEADDAIASYCVQNQNKTIYVISTDKDLWQLCEYPHVKVYNHFKNEIVHKGHLKEAFDIDNYTHIRLHKILWGDSGDAIPNLIQRMQKNLLPIIQKTDGTLDDFWVKVEENKKEISARCHELLQNRKGLEINSQLVTLKINLEVKVTQHPMV